jgi:hypothetical protein
MKNYALGGLKPTTNPEASKALVADLTLYHDEPDTDDVSKTANAAAKIVIDKTAVDSNKDWQTAYEKCYSGWPSVQEKWPARERGRKRRRYEPRRQATLTNLSSLVRGTCEWQP